MKCEIYQQNAAPIIVHIVELKLRQDIDAVADVNYEQKTSYTISTCVAKFF